MSHIVEAKTTIQYPNMREFLSVFQQGGVHAVSQLPLIALLRQAVTMVAKEQGGTVESYYRDYWDQSYEVNTGLALHIPKRANRSKDQTLPRGIGLSLDEHTGILTFVGDPYEVEDFYAAMQQRIIRTYVALAYSAAMRLEQYQHVSVRTDQEHLVVSGEIYAES